MTIQYKPTIKQHVVFDLLTDPNTTEILYGGSVGSGKSYLIAAIMVMYCIKYPGIRIGLAREHLTTLKKNTMTSVFEVLSNWKLTPQHYNYNSQSGEVKFYNESMIILCELAEIPSDPEYIRLSGLLLTMGFIDEAGEVPEKGKRIFQSRIGRWKNSELGIKPLLIMTCNPTKNFLYRQFYQPWKDGTLPPHRQFIQALPGDNPYLSDAYINNLKSSLTLTERRRLIDGEWDVDDETNSLFTWVDIKAIFDNSLSYNGDKTKYLSADIAFTSDKCIFVIWEGTTVLRIVEKEKNNNTVVQTIKQLCEEYEIRADHIAFDADGVGLFLREYFPIAKEIHNGGKSIKNEGYKNLKTELFFRLSELAKTGQFKILDDTYIDDITNELTVIKHKDRTSMQNAIELISKADMKKILGHSPDIADALAYGMIFHLEEQYMGIDDIVFLDF